MGGMVEAIEQGYPQREIAESSYRFQQAVEAKDKTIVGVNDYVADERTSVPTLYIDETTAERQIGRLRELRESRDHGRVRQALDELRRTAEGTGNTMYAILACVRAYATVGEMCDALREVWGEYEEAPSI
jgi:methylmalonyl-CoA mutase N-terminal domain/subunit